RAPRGRLRLPRSAGVSARRGCRTSRGGPNVAMSRDGHTETELQFEAPDLRWVERWLATCRRDDVTLEPQDGVWQEDEYLDSESFVVYRAGFALRLRRVAGKPA